MSGWSRRRLAQAGIGSLAIGGAAVALALLGALATPSCSAPAGDAPGEVVVVVTTDMAVPADLDQLHYTVTVVGDEAPFRDDVFPLSDPSVLPATLAVVSGHATPGPVDIRLEGLHAGAVRVHREARLTVPSRGVKALAMPLEWLCSDVNRSQDGAAPYDAQEPSCPPGQSCMAGDCADSLVPDAALLPDYVPAVAGPCFDTLDCFSQLPVPPGPPALDPATGLCLLTGNSAGLGMGVNFALVVDTSQGGNYGVCGGSVGDCLIAMDRGAPGGWQTRPFDGGSFPDIVLPVAVCRDSVRGTLKGVAVTASCDPKTGGRPSCKAPDACVRATTCPQDWKGWEGYTCGPAASLANPATQEPCFTLGPLEDGGGPTPPGGSCCTLGQTPSVDPLLIDDMSGGPLVKLTPPPGETAGYWFTVSGGGAALFPQPNTLFRYSSVPGPDGGPINAACLEAPPGFAGTYAIEAFNFVNVGSSDLALFDVTPYSGIRFWAYSPDFNYEPIWVQFPDLQTSGFYPGSLCQSRADAGGCDDDFEQVLALSNGWKEYSVRWSELQQTGYGASFAALDLLHVFSTQFYTQAVVFGQPLNFFKFCVADIYFTQDADAGDADAGDADAGDADAGANDP